LGHR